MPYIKSRFRTFNPNVTMRIGGKVVNKIDAKYIYRCAECLGELEYWNSGLACKADKSHRYFIHKRDVAAVQAAREAEVAEIGATYEIVDGILKPREELINGYQRT